MAKIKGWKQNNLIEYNWNNGNGVKIQIIKVAGSRWGVKQKPIYEYIRSFKGVTQSYLTFKTKKEAVDYAIKYMKLHPRG